MKPDVLLDMPTYAMSLLGRDARARMAGTLPGGLRLGHLAVLGTTADGPPLAQREIADRLQIHPSDVVALIDDLLARKLVRRATDPADRRRKLVTTTVAGHRLLTRAARDSSRIADEVLGALTETERATVVRLLRKALAA